MRYPTVFIYIHDPPDAETRTYYPICSPLKKIHTYPSLFLDCNQDTKNCEYEQEQKKILYAMEKKRTNEAIQAKETPPHKK